MKKNGVSKTCPLCGGLKRDGETTFTAELKFGVVVVRHVPATVCTQCGSNWIGDKTAVRLEQVMEHAKKSRHEVEVLSLA